MRSAQVVLPSLAMLAAALVAGCGGSSAPNIRPATQTQPEPEYSEVCVDERTRARVNDDRCDDDDHGGGGYVHHYYPHSQSVPAVGHPVTGGTGVKPAGTRVVKAPTIGRGGFGGHGSANTGG